MSDKSTQLVLEALSRAATDPAGVPLHGSKAAGGLFAGTALGKQAAQLCKEQNFLHVQRTETKGKTVQEFCTLTEKGLAYLLAQMNPKDVLEKLVRALEERQGQVASLVSVAEQSRASLEALKATVEKVIAQMQGSKTKGHVGISGAGTESNGSETWQGVMLSHLARWQASGTLEDCPLPELYRQVQQASPSLSVGKFHDGIRKLHQDEKIYLHPWTGPLYEMPAPECALLCGHEVAYYVSLRK